MKVIRIRKQFLSPFSPTRTVHPAAIRFFIAKNYKDKMTVAYYFTLFERLNVLMPSSATIP